MGPFTVQTSVARWAYRSPNGGPFCLAFHGFRVRVGFRVRLGFGIMVGFRVRASVGDL